MKKIYIFSYGLYPRQITLETLTALRECGEVYSHSLDAGLAGKFANLVPGLRLTPCRQNKAAGAVAAGLRKHSVVGLLTYGNPLFLNRTAAELIKAAGKGRTKVRVFAGVSSIDAIINLFNLNPYSPRGLRLVDVGSCLRGPAFTPEMDTLFFVPYLLNAPGNSGSRTEFLRAAKKAYPASAAAWLADCASISCSKGKKLRGKISGLPALLKKLHERHTIFIPAVK